MLYRPAIQILRGADRTVWSRNALERWTWHSTAKNKKARKILFGTKFSYISYIWLFVYYLYFLDPFWVPSTYFKPTRIRSQTNLGNAALWQLYYVYEPLFCRGWIICSKTYVDTLRTSIGLWVFKKQSPVPIFQEVFDSAIWAFTLSRTAPCLYYAVLVKTSTETCEKSRFRYSPSSSTWSVCPNDLRCSV